MNGTIITGVSQGLGKALFKILEKRSDIIIAVSRTFTTEQEQLALANPKRIFLLSVDLGSVGDAEMDKINSCLQELAVDSLLFINNASVIEPIGLIGSLDEKAMDHLFRVNLLSPAKLVNLIVARAADFRELKIVNISSGAAERPINGWSLYCASKAGFKMFIDTLQQQFQQSTTVHVINIDPGVIDTGMQQSIRNQCVEQFPDVNQFRSLKEKQQLQSPEEAAEKVLAKIDSHAHCSTV